MVSKNLKKTPVNSEGKTSILPPTCVDPPPLQKKSGDVQNTPQKTNMSPENQWLEDVYPIEIYSPFLEDMLVFWGVF